MAEEYDDLDDLLIDEDPRTLDTTELKIGKNDDSSKNEAATSTTIPKGEVGKDTEVEKMMTDLQAEFAGLLKQQENTDISDGSVSNEAIDNFNQLLGSLGQATTTDEDSKKDSSSKAGDETDFKNVIASTLDRLKESGSNIDTNLKEESASGPGSDDVLSQLLNQLVNDNSDNGDIDFNEDGMDNAILNILNQMSSKEVLYAPMKEMQDDFVKWFDENGNDEKHKDKIDIYRKQQSLVQELVSLYEREDYDNKLFQDEVTNLLDELEQLGDSPVSKGFNNSDINESGIDHLAKMLQVEGDDQNIGDMDNDIAENCKQQ
ncbi:Peroxisome chaperone and import receptor [Maudiozyma exigua]|uniref:Peroxisome chaperone and import receptor n=1 Tax=Maudiozyma exigua TaxID=34358 RepID=A0A9P6WFV5_MAUEX|nr:Peroxisome chaperone and import receptor [Kazachstania exigua]